MSGMRRRKNGQEENEIGDQQGVVGGEERGEEEEEGGEKEGVGEGEE